RGCSATPRAGLSPGRSAPSSRYAARCSDQETVRTGRAPSLLEARQVDREPVLHVALHRALVGLVHLLDRDDLDIGDDAVLAAVVEHLLGLGDAADERTHEPLAPPTETQA